MQQRTIIESSSPPASILKNALCANTGRATIAAAGCCGDLAWLAGASQCQDTQRDNFHRTRLISIAVRLLVKRVEFPDNVAPPINSQFKALALVAEIGSARQYGH